jgi:hypothetical protein
MYLVYLFVCSPSATEVSTEKMFWTIQLRKCFEHSMLLTLHVAPAKSFETQFPHDQAISFCSHFFLTSGFHTLWCCRAWWSNHMFWNSTGGDWKKTLLNTDGDPGFWQTLWISKTPAYILLLPRSIQSLVSQSNGRADPSLASVWQWNMQSRFAAQHVARVAKLSKALYHALIEQDGGEFLARTGALVRDRHLRTKRNRVAFQQIVHLCHEGENLEQSRFWTYSVVRNAIKCAMENMEHFYMEQTCLFPLNSLDVLSHFGCNLLSLMILFNP